MKKKIVMLGTAFDTKGGISAVVNVYREQGLFDRFPIAYLATHRDGSGLFKLWTLVSAWFRWLALIARSQVSMVHVHLSKAASFWRKSIFVWPAYWLGIPTVLHLHSGGFADFYEHTCGPWRKRLVRGLFNRAQHVIVLSESWQEWLSTISDARNVSVIYNPVVVPPEPLATERHAGRLLTLGRLGRGKGSYDLVNALAQLSPDGLKIEAHLGGDGELDHVRAHAMAVGVAEQVKLLGWVSGAGKDVELRQASIYLLPSYFEGMPMSVLEAMAYGLPVISTPVGGIGSVIRDGVDGLLVQPGDVGALAAAISKLLKDPELAQRMGRSGRLRVQERFSADVCVPQIERIYAMLGAKP